MTATCVALIAAASPAWAGLGRGLDSVHSDRLHFSAAMNSRTSSTYTEHTLTLANGGQVREFTNPSGVVFAVSWRGPGRPDLQQLLGERFAVLQADNAPEGFRRTRRPLSVNRPDFQVHSGGHPGAFWGVAYLPAEAPSGFSARDLQ